MNNLNPRREAYREPKGVQDKPAKLRPAEAEPPSSEAPKGVQDKPAKLHSGEVEPPEFLSADVTIAELAVTPPAVTHTGGPVASALSAGSAIPAAKGATSVGGPNGLVPITYSDQDLKENIVQVGALFEVSAAQPLVVTDVGGHRDQALFEAARRDYDVSLDGHHEPATPHEQFTWNVVTKRAYLPTVSSLRHFLAPVLLTTAALTLSAVGIAINGWFARSLGSSEIAGWLFLAVGVAADLAALILPSSSAGLWLAGQRATALVGWALWLVTFIFAVTAGVGFASTNIADVGLARASRTTPSVTTAQGALADAMAARDRECKGGVGKFCREREAAVAERRQLLDSAMTSVGQAADPQTDAAIKLVAWGSGGMLRPAPEDFAMLRLILLALLPQIGGVLLMVGRNSRPSPGRRGNAGS
jgi:hypothetical protein